MPVHRPILRRGRIGCEIPPVKVPAGPYRNWALMLGLDGTLIDLAGRPRHAEIPADLPRLLDQLFHALEGAVALFTGRTLEDADRLLSIPHLPIVAEYGAVIRVDDHVIRHAHGGEQCLDAVLAAIEGDVASAKSVD